MKKLFLICLMALSFISCQFQETMVLNADGTGRMSLSMDLSEMMAFGGEMSQDSSFVKQDTTVTFKSIFEAKKDSISNLSKAEQARIKKMENYSMRLVADPETNYMMLDVFTKFNNVSEANDLLQGFEQTTELMPGDSNDPVPTETGSDSQLIGVSYEFSNGVFKRDAYILNIEKHKAQMDSIQSAETFMGSMKYKIKYTFPKKIKSTSAEDATYSLNGRTIELERSFLDYFKNPDVLDLTVELEQ